MANVIIQLKVMPASVDVRRKEIEEACTGLIEKSGGKIHKIEEEPIAFGLIAYTFIFLRDEAKGDTENLEKEISELEVVQSAQTVDVRRTIG